jgi:hypothetical protein
MIKPDGAEGGATLEADGSLRLLAPNPDLEAILDARLERVPGELRWRRALDARSTGFVAKAASFVRSVTSGAASPETVALRRRSCFGQPGVAAPCEKLVTRDTGRFCAACGCGEWRLAELESKLTWARLDCPLRRPGFSNASP